MRNNIRSKRVKQTTYLRTTTFQNISKAAQKICEKNGIKKNEDRIIDMMGDNNMTLPR